MRRVPRSWTPPVQFLADLMATRPTGAPPPRGNLGRAEWDEFARQTVARQRLAPLVTRDLEHLSIPDAPRARIEAAAKRDAIEALHRIAENKRILDRFTADGVEPVVLKGWPLSLRLYGDAGLRQGRDLDILIPPEALADCHSALSQLGYRPMQSGDHRERLIGSRTLLRECNDLEYFHTANNHCVELAWRAHPVAGFPDMTADPANTRWLQTPIGHVKVLTDQAELIYLVLHGMLHMWLRLKWLVDIARLMELRGSDALEQDVALATELGIGKAMRFSLFLAHMILKTPLPPSLQGPPPAQFERQAMAVMHHMVRPQSEVAGMAARWQFYRFALPMADTGAQLIGHLRFGAWRRLAMGFAGLTARPPERRGAL